MPKPYWEKCSRGKLLRKLVKETLPANVCLLRRPGEVTARNDLITAGKAYCQARCGGCPMTWETPP